MAPAVLLLLAFAGELAVWHLLVGGAVSGFGTALQMVAKTNYKKVKRKEFEPSSLNVGAR